MTPFRPFKLASNRLQIASNCLSTHPPYTPLRFEGTGAGLKAAPSNAEGLRGLEGEP
jgi:hypothetical protein